MTTLALTTGEGIATAGAIAAAVWACVQLGDRLWRKEKTVSEVELSSQLHTIGAAMDALLRANTDMLRAHTEYMADARAQTKLSEGRHLEIMRTLSVLVDRHGGRDHGGRE